MFWTKNRSTVFAAASLTALVPLLMAGCGKNEADAPASAPSAATSSASTTSPAAAAGDATLVAAGKAAYDTANCIKCHAIGEQGGRMGPDLSHVAAEKEHTSDWIVAHVKNPKTHNPGSRMPAFAGKISDKDLLAIGAYLASLK